MQNKSKKKEKKRKNKSKKKENRNPGFGTYFWKIFIWEIQFFLHFEKCVPRVDNGGIKDFSKFSNFLFSFFHAKHFLQKLKKNAYIYYFALQITYRNIHSFFRFL